MKITMTPQNLEEFDDGGMQVIIEVEGQFSEA